MVDRSGGECFLKPGVLDCRPNQDAAVVTRNDVDSARMHHAFDGTPAAPHRNHLPARRNDCDIQSGGLEQLTRPSSRGDDDNTGVKALAARDYSRDSAALE